MNADFRDGYGAVPMSNWPDKRASAAICYLDASVTRAISLSSAPPPPPASCSKAAASPASPRAGGEVRQFNAGEVILSVGGVHSPAFLMRAGIGAAGHLREHGIALRADLPAWARSVQPRHRLPRAPSAPPRAAAGMAAAASHDRVSLFLRAAGRAADRHVHQRQCKTSWSPLGFQVANLAPSLLKPMARGRVSLTGADAAVPPCVEQSLGHELDLKRFMQGFRRAVEVLAHEQVRAMAGVTFPSSPTACAGSTASRPPTGCRAPSSPR